MLLVLKLGGGAQITTPTVQAQFCADVATLVRSGTQVVIINGANARLTQVQTERGFVPRMITSERGESSRYTDLETLNLLKEVYGQVRDELVAELTRAGVTARGLFGSTDGLVHAKRHGRQRIIEDGKIKVIEGDLTGSITEVDAAGLQALLDQGVVPVLAPPVAAIDGTEVNVDGDKLASKIAVALRADKLIFFSNTAGLLANVADPTSLISQIRVAEADQFAEGRMKKKVLSAARAVEAGVQQVVFADGRIAAPVTQALAGAGTLVLN